MAKKKRVVITAHSELDSMWKKDIPIELDYGHYSEYSNMAYFTSLVNFLHSHAGEFIVFNMDGRCLLNIRYEITKKRGE